MWRVWIEIVLDLDIPVDPQRHPPCGGCGLKFRYMLSFLGKSRASPSVWRVWIEIVTNNTALTVSGVTLRVEGVD